MSDTESTTEEAPETEPSWFSVYMGKFFAGLKDKVTKDDYDAAMKTARSSVGGLAKAHKAKAQTASELPGCDRKRFAEGDSYPGLFVGLFLDPNAASQLAIDGGQPAELLHITLAYFDDLEPDELTLARIVSRIDDACCWRAPLVGNVTGYTRFLATTGDTDVFAATPDVMGLAELAMSVDSAVESAFYPIAGPNTQAPRAEHSFVPHISLAFIAPGSPNPVDTLPDVALRFDNVTIAYGDRTILVPLRGTDEGAYGYDEVAVGDDKDGNPRLFMEQTFAEPPKRVAILPTPGSYAHSSYGTVDITADRVDRFVANHNAGVYGQKLPIQIDAGHDLKFSGAMGWLGSARIEDDGSATAEVFWNPRGEQLIKEDRFKYLSPEWFDSWVDGATGDKYDDVLIGLAVTNRPFFKNASLTPMAASENDPMTPATIRQEDTRVTSPTPVAMTEEQVKSLIEAAEQKTAQAFAERVTAAETRAQQADEKAERLTEEATTKAFKEEITGQGRANDGGKSYVFSAEFGDDYLTIMRTLATVPAVLEKFQTIERRKAQSFAELMKVAGKEVGSDARVASAADASGATINAKITQVMTEKSLSFGEAAAFVERENPQMFAEYRAATAHRV